jgi:DNA polymerase elongation subunit (family B)
LDIGDSPGKIKAMGLDLKRSDTPKVMQSFLEEILMDLLTGKNEEQIHTSIKDFRRTFRDLPGWQKGTPKKVNAVIEYTNRIDKSQQIGLGKLRGKNEKKISTMVPGHVQASINWNKMRQINKDLYSMEIQDGQKIIVCKLKANNNLGITSIAYPIDQMQLPDWFKCLPFDERTMEDTIIDKKIGNLVGVLNLNLAKSKEDTMFNDLFSFGSDNG